MEHIVFVDGMNLAWKAMHSYDLSTSSGVNTSAIYGFFSQLISSLNGKRIKTIVVWDGGYIERTKMSEEGMQKGFIKKSYKSDRGTVHEEHKKDPKLSTMNDQVRCIQEILDTTDIRQIKIDGQEADDVIASYCEKIKHKFSVLCLTCDHDYYQILDDNVSILNRWKGQESVFTKQSFVKDYGVEPYQWIEVGALCGDDSDSIEGVPGCGEETALKYIKQYHTANDLIAAMSAKFDAIRVNCPDLQTQNEVEELMLRGGIRGKSSTFDGCYIRMPFSGVAMALVKEEIKKISKIELKFAMYQERIRLAHKLKTMNRQLNIPNIFFKPNFNKNGFSSLCEKYEIKAFADKTEIFNLKEA